MTRVEPTVPLTKMQEVVCCMLALNLSHAEVAQNLCITRATVRHHLYAAVEKIPGDLPAEQRAVAWARGASLEVLTGRDLKLDMLDKASAWENPDRRRTNTVSGAR